MRSAACLGDPGGVHGGGSLSTCSSNRRHDVPPLQEPGRSGWEFVPLAAVYVIEITASTVLFLFPFFLLSPVCLGCVITLYVVEQHKYSSASNACVMYVAPKPHNPGCHPCAQCLGTLGQACTTTRASTFHGVHIPAVVCMMQHDEKRPPPHRTGHTQSGHAKPPRPVPPDAHRLACIDAEACYIPKR